jgi:hypothetical protein
VRTLSSWQDSTPVLASLNAARINICKAKLATWATRTLQSTTLTCTVETYNVRVYPLRNSISSSASPLAKRQTASNKGLENKQSTRSSKGHLVPEKAQLAVLQLGDAAVEASKCCAVRLQLSRSLRNAKKAMSTKCWEHTKERALGSSHSECGHECAERTDTDSKAACKPRTTGATTVDKSKQRQIKGKIRLEQAAPRGSGGWARGSSRTPWASCEAGAAGAANNQFTARERQTVSK